MVSLFWALCWFGPPERVLSGTAKTLNPIPPVTPKSGTSPQSEPRLSPFAPGALGGSLPLPRLLGFSRLVARFRRGGAWESGMTWNRFSLAFHMGIFRWGLLLLGWYLVISGLHMGISPAWGWFKGKPKGTCKLGGPGSKVVACLLEFL